jgi:hypothetical protein
MDITMLFVRLALIPLLPRLHVPSVIFVLLIPAVVLVFLVIFLSEAADVFDAPTMLNNNIHEMAAHVNTAKRRNCI